MEEKNDPPESAVERFERAVAEARDRPYLLRLYVAGSTPRSVRAIQTLKPLCEKHLRGRYKLEVVDVRQQPESIKQAQLVALPTLVKLLPLPLRRLVGDLSDAEKVLLGLDLLPRD